MDTTRDMAASPNRGYIDHQPVYRRALELDAGPTGTVFYAGDPGWDGACAAWIADVDQHPAAAAVVRSAEDVSAIVVSAAERGLKVMAQATGHGAMTLGSLTNTVLIRTSALAQVEIDPSQRTAWCGAGAEWGAIAAAAAGHGLAAQAGSSPDVGATGYLLSGGLSWLSRQRGLAVNDVLRLEVVTAEGAVRRVDAGHDPDLFWALRGGGGSFGIVTAVELRLHVLPTAAAGTLFFPISRGGEVLHAWRRWIEGVSERTMSCGRLLQFPPLPELPPLLRGQAFTVVEVAHQGTLAELDATIRPLRNLDPSMDTITEIPVPALADLHMDPPGPVPCRGNGMLLKDLPPNAIDALVATAGQGSGSPLASVELRHLGGAIARRPPHAGALSHLDAKFLLYAVGFTPDPASMTKVEAHIERVERALRPWSADLHYANLDERADGGRTRFHDRITLERLHAIKSRIDPGNVITSGHPVATET